MSKSVEDLLKIANALLENIEKEQLNEHDAYEVIELLREHLLPKSNKIVRSI